MQASIGFLQDLIRNFRVADLFDIAIISLFIYWVLAWFRRTTSRGVVAGILVLIGVYLLARTFDLYLTSLLFKTIFAVSLVAAVVVFQEEIRRGFEQIALWGSFRERRKRARFPGVDALVEGVSTLASNKTGALIVIRGREALERHIEGGIPLFGRISKPLLYSLTDPHSPGHDGAILLEGDRITKFGAHLPLSKNLSEVGTVGTRHAAAVGISECSDCFVIAISEERGVISTAQNGRLEEASSAAELKGRLERFYGEHFPRSQKEPQGWLSRDTRLKMVSVALACAGWFMFAYEPVVVQRTFAVPIEYRNVPKDVVLEGYTPSEAMVTLSGSERDFRLLNPTKLIVSVDLSNIQFGTQWLPITEDHLRKPPTLGVYRIDPNGVRIWAYPEVKQQK